MSEWLPFSIIDRYVLASFLKNYAISFGVLIGLFIVMDTVFNFSDFVVDADDLGPLQIIAGIARYYFYQIFFVFSQLAGVIPVLAAAFTFMRMSRFNELSALLASGMPMLRIAAPVVLCSIAINLIVQPINQEFIIPTIAPNLAVEKEDVVPGVRSAFPVRAMPDGRGGILDVVRYNPATDERGAFAESVTVVERDGQSLRVLAAARAVYDPQQNGWLLENATLLDNLVAPSPAALLDPDPLLPQGYPELVTTGFWQTDITPAEIELFRSAGLGVGAGGSYYDLLSLAQMNELLQQPDRYNATSLLRAKHTRLAGHVMNVILILLAIPCVLTRQPNQLKRAAGKTVVLVGGAMATIFLSQMLGKDAPTPNLAGVWPQIVAWLPVLSYGPTAFVLLDKMKT